MVIISCAILVICLASVQATPCDVSKSVIITDGAKNPDGSVLHNRILYDAKGIFKSHVNGSEETRGCPCLEKPCIRKCCHQGQAMMDYRCHESTTSLLQPFSPDVYDNEKKLNSVKSSEIFHFVSELPPCEKIYLINPALDEQQMFYLQTDGSILVWQTPTKEEYFVPDRYCLEVWDDDPEADPEAPPKNASAWKPAVLMVACLPTQKTNLMIVFPVGMIISLPFLIVTFLVYALIPELQNFHGKALMMYVFALIIAYSFLAHVQLQGSKSNYIPPTPCTTYALIIYFSLMMTFFWLNVMCIDIWLTFRDLRSLNNRWVTKSRRFLLYCIYAFGTPVVLTAVVVIINFQTNLPRNIIMPEIGGIKCWFSDKRAELAYFYSPMIILVMCNITLFGLTAYNIFKVKKETSIATSKSTRHSQFQKDKERLLLYVKLFVVMGVGWVMEWLSFLVGGSPLWWILTDICNTLHGVFIFFVFVFQQRVKRLLIKRYQTWRYGMSTVLSAEHRRTRSNNRTANNVELQEITSNSQQQ